ncbi:hypothetical protein [Clostridium beijerinckii]|uniref:hypothetical protein n=1 Tax=Clostridium beijerinckii TaxID=1520 RepID=UPI001493F3B6|nr:hypothetical protein [Clostridium beijerinckii]NOW07837.1 hypothetical protein [Clostridium beijerinckii]NYC05468.1 hypothetical protein [Clostridium beijerinckii]
MYCVIKNDMKFGEYFIKGGTKARVINKPNYKEANIPGLDLYLAINLSDIALQQKESVLESEIRIKNELEERCHSNTEMVGITLITDGTKVLMDAGADFYEEATIYDSQVKRVLEIENIPEKIKKAQYLNRPYYLRSIIEYLDNEFAQWVQDNCEFYVYTEEDIKNGDCWADAEPGDTTLSDKGIEQFKNKKIEYQKMLEKIGFTYDFKGGLVWE